MIYQIHNGAVMYGAETILKNINFEIKNNKEKIDSEIVRAKSDEEILAIVNSIVAANNKLCNNKKK